MKTAHCPVTQPRESWPFFFFARVLCNVFAVAAACAAVSHFGQRAHTDMDMQHIWSRYVSGRCSLVSIIGSLPSAADADADFFSTCFPWPRSAAMCYSDDAPVCAITCVGSDENVNSFILTPFWWLRSRWERRIRTFHEFWNISAAQPELTSPSAGRLLRLLYPSAADLV